MLSPPSEFVPESAKTSAWFCSQARWAISAFYNQSRSSFSSHDIQLNGIAEEAIANWSYVFKKQQNFQYKYATEDYSNVALPAVWTAGGKIKSLYDHLSGILLGAIDNIEVTAQNLSKGVASYRAELHEKLLIKWEIDQVAKDMLPEGVSFEPINDPEAQLNNPAEIEKYVTSWQDKYSIIAEKIGRSQVVMDDMKPKFLQDGQHQIVGGLSGMLTEVLNGNLVNTVIPGFELIWDNRGSDPWGEDALLCGYMKHSMPYQDVIRMYGKDMDEKDVEEIHRLAKSGYSNMDEFVTYYNTGLGVGNRYNWWGHAGTSNMTVGVATLYFIGPRDWRYKESSNRYGAKRVMEITDDKEYVIDGKKIKGVDMPGDYQGYDLHQVTLIGNKYVTGYGYANNVLRKHNNKGKPLLPIQTFCSNMVLNQGMGLVSALRADQDELDLYAFKIKEKVSGDWGKNYVFNGNKFPGAIPTQIANELKSLHVTVSVPSGEADDPYAAQRMVETFDMTLDNNIIRYIELCQVIEARMETVASVSKIALGQQPAVIGKAVQEQTIERNSYGTATLFWGLMRHFNKVLQYNVNLKQMLYQFSDTVEESLIIGDEGSYLLKILNPREFGTQELVVFIELASTLDPQMRAELKSIALGVAQNGGLDLVDYIENVLMAPTMNQGLKGLKDARNKKERDLKEQAAAQSVLSTQEQQQVIQAQTISQASLIQLKEDNANFRTQYTEDMKAFTKQMELIADRLSQIAPPAPPPISPLQIQLAAASQPQPQQQESNLQPL